MSALRTWLAAHEPPPFLPPEAIEIFEGCFDLQLCELRGGETFDSAGRLAYLLHGSGKADGLALAPGAFFGADAEGRPHAETFAASGDCALLCWDSDVLSHVCYRACWFHVRLLNEARGKKKK